MRTMFILCCLSVLMPHLNAQSRGLSFGKISFFTRDCQVTRMEKNLDLEMGLPLKTGDTILTGATESLLIQLDESRLLIGANAKAILVAKTSKEIKVTLLSGNLRWESQAENRPPLILSTPLIVCTFAGGDYVVQWSDSCTISSIKGDGTVEKFRKSPGPKWNQVKIEEGQQLTVLASGQLDQLKNLSEDELHSLKRKLLFTEAPIRRRAQRPRREASNANNTGE